MITQKIAGVLNIACSGFIFSMDKDSTANIIAIIGVIITGIIQILTYIDNKRKNKKQKGVTK